MGRRVVCRAASEPEEAYGQRLRARVSLVATRRNGEPVVMLSSAEYDSLEETLHLLRDPANTAWACLRSIRQAEAGKLAEHDIGE